MILSTDSTVRSTEDHPLLKNDMPLWLRKQRDLTEAEHGLNPSTERPFQKYSARFDPRTNIYQITKFPFITIDVRGDVAVLSERISYLASSDLGSKFLGSLSRLRGGVSLSIYNWKGRRLQVVVDFKNTWRAGFIQPKELPLDWVPKGDRIRCDAFLKAVSQGTACIQIDPTHPQRTAILEALEEISMRSIGVRFLLELEQYSRSIEIYYQKGRNECRFQENRIFVFLDIADKAPVATLEKETNRILPISDIEDRYFVWHELVHAYHIIRGIVYGSPTWRQYFVGCTLYQRDMKEYVYIGDKLFRRWHSNFEEQATICGFGGPFSENTLRFAFFDPLRYGHYGYRVLAGMGITKIDSFVGDPCADGDLNRVAMMILKVDQIYAQEILGIASREERILGVQQVEKFELNQWQRQLLDSVRATF